MNYKKVDTCPTTTAKWIHFSFEWTFEVRRVKGHIWTNLILLYCFSGEKSEGSDSDLESASHEITKQYGNKSEGSNKVELQRKQQKKELKKRTVVVKSSGSWAVPTYARGTERMRCYKRSIRETPRRSGSVSGVNIFSFSLLKENDCTKWDFGFG